MLGAEEEDGLPDLDNDGIVLGDSLGLLLGMGACEGELTGLADGTFVGFVDFCGFFVGLGVGTFVRVVVGAVSSVATGVVIVVGLDVSLQSNVPFDPLFESLFDPPFDPLFEWQFESLFDPIFPFDVVEEVLVVVNEVGENAPFDLLSGANVLDLLSDSLLLASPTLWQANTSSIKCGNRRNFQDNQNSR